MFALVITSGSPVTISEVMANVKGSDSGLPGQRNEFVEIYNLSGDTVDLDGWSVYDFDPAHPDPLFPWHDSTILVKYPNLRISSTRLYPYAYALILDRDYTRADTGLYLQPYLIPDQTLVVTTDDRTIGDGLSTKDPLILYSSELACTTSYGTPFNEQDTIPFDPGDGISAERIELALRDSIDNWWPCFDASGSTPGRDNSAAKSYDLAVDPEAIAFRPATVEVGEDVQIEVRVTNCGLRTCAGWKLRVFRDENQNGGEDDGEMLSETPGPDLLRQQHGTMTSSYSRPNLGEHRIGVRVLHPLDRDTLNNLAFKPLWVVGKIGSVGVMPSPFSPDGDGVDDLLQVDYRLPQPGGELTLAVYDANGIKQADLVSRQKQNQDHGTLFWKGTNRSGRVLPAGIYIVFMEYRSGMTTLKVKKTAVLAKRSRRR